MRIFLLLIVLIGCSNYCEAQSSSQKELYIVYKSFGDKSCSATVLKIQGEKVALDACCELDVDLEGFNPSSTFPLKKKKVLAELYQNSFSTLKNIEQELIATNCDYLPCFHFIILENGKRRTVKWRRTLGCYPPKIKPMITQLETIFMKYQPTIKYH